MPEDDEGEALGPGLGVGEVRCAFGAVGHPFIVQSSVRKSR